MEKPEQKQNDKVHTVQPIGAIMDKARDELGAMIIRYMNDSGLPAYLFDYVLSDIVGKVKELKASEYAAIIGRGESDGEHKEPVE